jgi:fumarylacetoacetase
VSGAPSWISVPAGSPFPITNLPFGVGHPGNDIWRAWVAIGDVALDLDAVHAAGAFGSIDLPRGCFSERSLNSYLGSGPAVWSATRSRLIDLLTDHSVAEMLRPHLVDRSSVIMGVPTAPTDYVDFYSSLHHAVNVGRIFRPDNEPLLPNWRYIPVGYHGRTGTLVADGASIPRPSGYRLVHGVPVVGPSNALDIELEVASVIGVGSERGTPVDIDAASQHLYGMCLLNDWSARDIQAFEYQPLGPFLGKSFATSVAPWLVSLEALEPFRVDPPFQDPSPAAYLSTDQPWAFDLRLEVWIQSARMRELGIEAHLISSVGFADMYWTPAQQLAHLTVTGASTSTGDLFGSGTVSGPTPGCEGSLIELTSNGQRPFDLPDGSTRTFLLDGDQVELHGWAGNDPATRIGLGSVAGTIAAAPAPASSGGASGSAASGSIG